MALNEILLLKTVFPRPLHLNDFEGPEEEVIPIPGIGFRVTNSPDRPKKDTYFLLTAIHKMYSETQAHL